MPELLRTGGLVALVASVFDMPTARLARLDQVRRLPDSTMDRYSDMLLLHGAAASLSAPPSTGFMVLVWAAAFGSFHDLLRAGARRDLIRAGTVGFLERRSGSSSSDRRRLQPHGRGAVIIAVLANLTADPARGLHLRRAQEGLDPRAEKAGP